MSTIHRNWMFRTGLLKCSDDDNILTVMLKGESGFRFMMKIFNRPRLKQIYYQQTTN
jgi:hypothetical protein